MHYLKKFIRLWLTICCFLSFWGCQSKKLTYTIAIDPSWFPLDLANKESNMSAFSQELVEHIFKKRNFPLSVMLCSYELAMDRLDKQEIEGFLTYIEPYVFNRKKFYFSDNYFFLGPVVVLREKEASMLKAELFEKEIAVFSNQDEQILSDLYPKALARKYDSVPKALTDVVIGMIDGAFVPALLASSYIKDIYHGHLSVFTKPASNRGLKLITSSQKPKKYVEEFNRGLEEIKASGEYNKLLEQWKLIN